MTVSPRPFITGGRLFATVVGLGVAATLACAQPPAADPAAAPPEGTPPVGGDALLWLRRPGEILDRPESGGEPRREGRGEDEIETDRDSFTPAISTAGRGRLIVESAYSFLDNRHVPETHSFPELLLRYGVAERVELRLGWNYEVGGAGNDTSGSQGGEGLQGVG
jgi:hypothetical protein